MAAHPRLLPAGVNTACHHAILRYVSSRLRVRTYSQLAWLVNFFSALSGPPRPHRHSSSHMRTHREHASLLSQSQPEPAPRAMRVCVCLQCGAVRRRAIATCVRCFAGVLGTRRSPLALADRTVPRRGLARFTLHAPQHVRRRHGHNIVARTAQHRPTRPDSYRAGARQNERGVRCQPRAGQGRPFRDAAACAVSLLAVLDFSLSTTASAAASRTRCTPGPAPTTLSLEKDSPPRH